jgi:GT2 family glycosyltransferase
LPIRRLYESKQGLSNARNCALDHAQGELLLWTDDDVLVEPNWLAEYARVARQWPDAVYFGGYIEPWFERTPPQWLVAHRERFGGLLVIRDFGPTERPFEGEEQPFGANMAFRMPILHELKFDPNLGKVRDECILADETTLFQIIRRQGLPGVWVPQARVSHYVPVARMKMRYVWHYFHGLGRTAQRVKCLIEDSGPCWRGAPRWWYRRSLELVTKAWVKRLMFRKSWVATYLSAAHLAGRIAEARHQWSLRRTPQTEYFSSKICKGS